MIPLFDGHCDTLLNLELRRMPVGSLAKNNLHINLERYGSYAPAAQFFAVFGMKVFMPDGDIFDRLSGRLFAEVEANPDKIRFCTCAADAQAAAAEGKLAAFLSVEGAELLDCGARLEEAHERGVRAITLTWNNATEIAGTNVQETERGLSEKGKDFVRRCDELGILVDVSHLSDPGFWDVIETSKNPIIASHSNSRAVCGHTRNLTDDQFRALRDKGGTTGLNLYTQFLGEDKVTVETCVRHIEHFLELGGEKTIAIGGDLDGCDKLPEGMTGVDGTALVYQALADRGYPKALLDDIFYNNLMRVVREVCDM